MEDYAIILANDLVVKASNFGGISKVGFNKGGKVISFIYEGLKYTALFEFKSNEFLDYVDEGYFQKLKDKEIQKEGEKYDGVEKKLWESYVFKKYDKLNVAQFNDTIFGILRDSSGLCYNNFTWQYTNPYIAPKNPQPAPNASAKGKFCETFANGTHAKTFFDKYKTYTFLDTDESDIRLIGEIASLLKNAGEKTTEAFLNFNLTGVDTTKFTFHTTENQLSRAELLKYKNGLELWLKMLKKYQTEISKLGHEEQLFIVIDVMYRHNMLTLLSVDQRISILKILVEKRPLMNWYFENFTKVFHKEDLAIHILESVTNKEDADDFLQKLISTNVIESEYKHKKVTYNTYITLYKMLFYRMDDYFGKDNFTAYVEELNRIVLLKNNIEKREVPPEYTTEQIKQLTCAQFIWREKRVKNGPNKDRRKYEITSNTDKKIKIKETIFYKVKLQEVYHANSVGVPVFAGYEEVTTEKLETSFELDHFDLVSIHFYDNPSFVDLTSDESYKGKHYFTFAGFIDYLLEKENTKVAEEVFNAALYAISLAIGFGEVVAAVRGINVLRAFLGVVMISSDTALYLSGETSFRNYIVEKYPNDYQQILGNLQLFSTFLSFGTNVVAGSGILNQFSKAEATKFVGTAEAILKDSEALSILSTEEIAGLKEMVKKVKNELYILRNEEEVIHTIVRTQVKIRLNKYAPIRNELEIIEEASKNRLYDDLFNVSEDFIIQIEKTPDFIKYWDTLPESEKLAFNLNKTGSYKIWYVVRTEAKALERFNLKLIDLDTGKPFRLPECRTWVDLQTQSKGLFEPLPYGKIGDVLGMSGSYNSISLSGKTIDFWGLPKGALLSNNFNGAQRIKSINKLLESIDDHFIKFFNSTKYPGESLDIFVMDLRYYDQDLEIKNMVLNYINDPNYFYKNLRDNPNYFMLINN
ncbi:MULTISPECIES: hypothetical protein [unclassified Flavobacterium]|uniref:hypothetical protein n=1 Tax=unclassified Flavobacterium TaxID=196869 RepID=UPI000F509CA4|nr:MULTISPECIES: hypothetical protein [unclassified Flavobacterium]